MEELQWDADDFLARLYGIGPPDGHLATCSECRARMELLRQRRESLRATDPELSSEFLSRQRLAVYERIEQRPVWVRMRPAPFLAALLLAFVILTVFKPAPKHPAETTPEVGVFEDVFETAASAEPSALEPARMLFEVEQ